MDAYAAKSGEKSAKWIQKRSTLFQTNIREQALHKRKADMEIKKIAHFEYNLIDKLEQNDVVLNDNKSLLLLATRSKHNGLFDVLNEKDDGMLPKSLRSIAEQMILPNSNNRVCYRNL